MKDRSNALQQQYRDSTNFRKRTRLIAKFSSNRYPWYRWVFDQFEFHSASLDSIARTRNHNGPGDVLELGCGPGSLWKHNLDRIPPSRTIVLSDFSTGMLRDCALNLGAHSSRFRLCQLDASALPFRASSFDAVIANMMFYHVEDRRAALCDIRRVLDAGGRFYATTTGRDYMDELTAAANRILQVPRTPSAERFGLETGYDQLRSVFARVQVRHYRNTLRVTELAPLIDYFRSMEPFISVASERWAALAEYFQHRIDDAGEIVIPIHVGMLIAQD